MMISAWKRFINKSDSSQLSSHDANNHVNEIPPGIQKMDKKLQQKFAHGVSYNLRVVIKGDTRVGKTALFRRLEGFEFDENYKPTENLTVTSINWNYKATDDVVKIDLWEAIDPIWRKNNNAIDLKVDNNESPEPETSHIDTPQFKLPSNNIKNPIPESAKQSLAELSENIDFYKGTDAALLVLDMTKLWTFKYIQSELPKVPNHIPVLVIANHRDQGHHRTVSSDQVKAFIDGLERNPGDAVIMYTETSMKNGFGLNLVKKFFNIPYLKLQETSLLKHLELNRCDYMLTMEELELMQDSIDREYEQYLELKTLIRRQQADAMSPINVGFKELDECTKEKIRNASMSSSDVGKDLTTVKSLGSNNNDKPSIAQSIAGQKFVNNRIPSIVIGAKCSLPETKAIQLKRTGNAKSEPGRVESDDKNSQCSDESDIDEVPRANPLVAGYQSDLDSDDQIASS